VQDTTITDANLDNNEFADALDNRFSAKSNNNNSALDTTMPALNVSNANTYMPPIASKLVIDSNLNCLIYKPY
jgi:hypothetical protein